MSTAGKVLVVLVALTTLVWMILAAGVAQLNRNASKALHDLGEQVAKAQVQLKETQDQIVKNRDETSSVQEKTDRELTVLRTRLAGVEESRSQVVDSLNNAKYRLSTIEETIKSAKTALENRMAERDAEEKALAAAKAEVESLIVDTGQLASRLHSLRQSFQSTYKSNLELIGKSR